MDGGRLTTPRSFGHPEFVEGYLYYAKTILVRYADRVGTWYSFNEPSIEGNMVDFGFGSQGAAAGWNYTRNVLDAHASIVHWYRDELKGTGLWSFKLELSGTGFALPLDPANPSDVEAAERRNTFNVAMFANPVYLGRNVPESMAVHGFQQYTDEELAFYKGTADFFAFDIYTASYHSAPEGGIDACAGDEEHPLFPYCTVTERNRTAQWQENFIADVDRVAVGYSPPSSVSQNAHVCPMLTFLSQLPPSAIRALLGYWQHTYPSQHGITIGEFGLPTYKAVEMTPEQLAMDPSQGNFYVPILREVLKAINIDGVKMKGLFGWSYIDNWEWGYYQIMYGLQTYDKVTMERRFKRGIFDYSDFMLRHTEE